MTIACEGPEGPIGPQGPQGPQGETGPQGPAGNDGADGADGINGTNGTDGADGADGADGQDAEVIYSNWIQLTDANWNKNASNFNYQHNTTAFTETRRNSAAIMFYAKIDGYSDVFPLPTNTSGLDEWFSDGISGRFYDFFISRVTGSYFYLYMVNPNGTLSTSLGMSNMSVRFLIIPGTTSTSGRMDLDWRNYEDVIEAYNIPD